MIKINFKAIAVIVVIHQVLGFVWYDLNIFGTVWMESLGKTVDDFNMEDTSPFIYSIVYSFLMSFVMAYIFAEILIDTWQEGIRYSFLMWLGFFASAYTTHLSFGQFPVTLALVDTGKELVAFLIAGLILSTWIRRR